LSNIEIDEAVMPLPNALITPPETKIYLVFAIKNYLICEK
jgi:hypothetical protein